MKVATCPLGPEAPPWITAAMVKGEGAAGHVPCHTLWVMIPSSSHLNLFLPGAHVGMEGLMGELPDRGTELG